VLTAVVPCYLSVMLPVIAVKITLEDRVPLTWRLACVAAWAAAWCVVGLYVLAVYRLARAAGPARRAALAAEWRTVCLPR